MRAGIELDYHGLNRIDENRFRALEEHINHHYWDDERFPAVATKPGPGGNITYDHTNLGWSFAWNSQYTENDQLSFICQMPHKKLLGAKAYVHIHWDQVKDYVPNVLFEYRWYNNGRTIPSTWTIEILKDTIFDYNDSSHFAQLSTFKAIAPPDNEKLSSMLEIKAYRDQDNSDGLFSTTCPYNTGGNSSWLLKEIDIHIQRDAPGSWREYDKYRRL